MENIELRKVPCGETFTVFGEEFVLLDHVDGGVLSIRKEIWKKAVFDRSGNSNLAQADRLLGKDICLGKESISGEVTEIAINSDGIFAYVRSGGGGFYIKPIDVLEESDNGKERLP